MTKLYFAPLEGITTSVYRRVHARMFGGCDAYFAPFIVPSETERVTEKRLRDILPAQNAGISLRVQVLSDSADAICALGEKIGTLGYDELNLNVGCPAPTVVSKGRGATQLCDPDKLDKLLDDIFRKTRLQISVKTRLGFSESAEFKQLLPVFNRYPLSLLILHPRTRAQFYGGTPDIEAFSAAYIETKNSLCYNGNVGSSADFFDITDRFPQLHSIMIGRGAVRNPAVFREIRGGAPLKTEELLAFSDLLFREYRAARLGENQAVQKLKEIWTYAMENFPEEKKIGKAIKKATTAEALFSAIRALPEIERRKK